MYKIIRFFHYGSGNSRPMQTTRRTIKTGLTLEEAQAHCRNPQTSSRTSTDSRASKYRRMGVSAWFDGYEECKR